MPSLQGTKMPSFRIIIAASALLLAIITAPVLVSVSAEANNKAHLLRTLTAKRRDTFKQEKRASSDATHELVFAVHQLNLDKLEAEVVHRATPGSPLYQQWLTFDEVGAMIENKNAFQLVSDFLANHVKDASVSKVTARKEYITVSAPISSWESALKTQFYEWHDLGRLDENGKPYVYIRSLTYTIPDSLEDHLDHIFNTIQVPPLLNNKPHRTSVDLNEIQNLDLQASCTPLAGYTQATPSFLNSLYGINTNAGSTSYKQAVFETSEESFSPSDLSKFQSSHGIPKQKCEAPFGFSTTECTSNCYEGNLDVQYIMAIAQKTKTIYYYVNCNSTCVDPFVEFVTDLANSPHPPQVNSISWGENEYYVDASTASSFNNEAMKLGAIGVTVTVSSGDNGAPSLISGVTQSLCGCPGVKIGGISTDGYTASFPATSPFVTAVGATMGPTCNNGPEVVSSAGENAVITSGGGFSDLYPAPSWQKNAISNYFKTVTPLPVTGYATGGRGYPDVAMLGVDYPVIVQGATVILFGTSASSPVFAALVTLVNSQRLSNGQGPVGFINPTLYNATYSLFTDVTTGNNNCCSGSPAATVTCCSTGFSAAPEWDPATGLGSITLQNLYTALSALNTSLLPDDRLGDDYPPTDDTDDTSTGSSSPSNISAGGIVGIVIAIVAILVAIFFISRCMSQRNVKQGSYSIETSNPMSKPLSSSSTTRRVDV